MVLAACFHQQGDRPLGCSSLLHPPSCTRQVLDPVLCGSDGAARVRWSTLSSGVRPTPVNRIGVTLILLDPSFRTVNQWAGSGACARVWGKGRSDPRPWRLAQLWPEPTGPGRGVTECAGFKAFRWSLRPVWFDGRPCRSRTHHQRAVFSSGRHPYGSMCFV